MHTLKEEIIMTKAMDINNTSGRILNDINDSSVQTDINNANELTNISIVNGQMDVNNINEHKSTCRHVNKVTHKVRIYFRSKYHRFGL